MCVLFVPTFIVTEFTYADYEEMSEKRPKKRKKQA